jgi:1-deoxy-D-xylulose-5-phosphate reductoisomerase
VSGSGLRISILGSTGSIGRQCLEVVESHPDRFRIVGLSSQRNLDLLREQARRFRPRLVAIGTPKGRESSRIAGARVASGPEALIELATLSHADIVVNALMGAAGLPPTLAAIRAGKRLALANKETLVIAGEIVVREARRKGITILPIDSEHSALHQCLAGRRRREIRRLVLTASGGSVRRVRRTRLGAVTVAQALNHPTWKMGRKITIDSATLMNKGLEVIEAHWLFGFPPAEIDVVIHPQSIVHSLVELIDGSLLAQLSCPDMRLPIQYALTYPERLPSLVPPLNLAVLGRLDFQAVDARRFPCLRLAYEALEAGGTMPAVLNAANEVSVQAFLEERIGFARIPEVIAEAMERHRTRSRPSLDEILEADARARREAFRLCRT